MNIDIFLDRNILETTSRSMSKPLQVKTLESSDYARWDAFVGQCLEATFFHHAGWKEVIEQAFGHRTYYLYAEASGRIVGILPLVHVNSLFFGNALTSTPFCVYGGVAAYTDDARRMLDEAARNLAQRLRVDYLELRNLTPHDPPWPSSDLYVTFRKEVHPDPEANMRDIPRKQRAMVRKGMQAGLSSVVDPDIDRFFEVYAESVRNLGTPVFPRKYFALLKQQFGEHCELLTITREDRAVAGVLSFYFRDQVLPYYGGSTREGHALRGANDFMYWELMRRACERGYRVFDYGRSKRGTGCYDFKKNWGFEPEPLHYEYHLVKAKEVPNNKNPLNPRYRMLVGTWRYLPLPVSRVLGPFISKDLG